MAHSDDNGLVLPPRLAPVHVAIVPIYQKPEHLSQLAEKILPLKKELEAKGLVVKFDDRDTVKPGFKFAEHELKGVPARIAMGPRDMENGTVEIARRDTLEKTTCPIGETVQRVTSLMDEIQDTIYNKALNFRKANTYTTDSYQQFKEILDKGGFIMAHWDGASETEERIKDETKATVRCIPIDAPDEDGKCILTGNPSKRRVLFARAY
jgi:prolyl-tRNA synthetase